MGFDPLYIVESDTALLDYAKSEQSDGQCQFFDDAVLFRDGLASEIIPCARFGTAPPIGVLEHTSDCPDLSCMLDFKNARNKSSELFYIGIDLAFYLMPQIIIQEMTPPNASNATAYEYVIKEYTDMGYSVTWANRFPSAAVGDKTDRERFILVAHRGSAIDFTSDLPPISGAIRHCLVDSSDCPDDLYIKSEFGNPINWLFPSYSAPIVNMSEQERIMHVPARGNLPSRCITLGDVPWDGFNGERTNVYSIDGLINTQTRYFDGLIMDDKGVRYMMIEERMRAAGLESPTLLRFLLSVPRPKAHQYLAQAVTGGVIRHLYDIAATTLNTTSIAPFAVDSPQPPESALPTLVDSNALSGADVVAQSPPEQPVTRPITRPSSNVRKSPIPGSTAFWRTLSMLCRFHQDSNHAGTDPMKELLTRGHISNGLTPADVDLFPECAVCAANELHRRPSRKAANTSRPMYLPGACWYLDDEHIGITGAFGRGNYVRSWYDSATGFGLAMFPKNLTAASLRLDIIKLIEFQSQVHGSRRLKYIFCDKFSAYLDRSVVNKVLAEFGIELIPNAPHCADMHGCVEDMHRRCQRGRQLCHAGLIGRKMLNGLMVHDPKDNRQFTVNNDCCWWEASTTYLGESTTSTMGESTLLPTGVIDGNYTPTATTGTTSLGIPRLTQRRTAMSMMSDPLFNVESDADNDDSPLNVRDRAPLPPTDVYSTLLRKKGQSVTDDIPVKDILQYYKDTGISINFPVDKYKKPRWDVNGNNINKSFERFERYCHASTTREFFTIHEGTKRQAEQDFYNDVSKGILVIIDTIHENMLFMFAPEYTDHAHFEQVYLLETSVGLEPEIGAFRDHLLRGSDDAGDITVPLHVLLSRTAQLSHVSAAIQSSVTHDTGDYMLRVEDLADHIRASTHCSTIIDDIAEDCAHEIVLHLVDSADYEVVIDETKIASLKGLNGEARENMIKAIAREIVGIIDVSTFELIMIPHGRKEIPTKLVLKVKYRADGTFDKNKARLVVQGFHQVQGRDFHATFAPMASFVNVRLIMSLAVQNGWDLKHADVPQAFLRSNMDTEVFVRLARGISLRDRRDGSDPINNGMSLRLLKSIYGLRQSPQLWNKEINTFMVDEMGFTRGSNESSMYHRHDANSGDITICLLEVDDLLVTGNNDILIEKFHQELDKKYGTGAEGALPITWENLSSFLGVNIIYDRDRRVLTMDVASKIDKLFDEHDALAKIPTRYTPLPSKDTPKHTHPAATMDYVKSNYQSLVGSMIYMSVSCRPDMSYGIGRLSRHMHSPTEEAILECLHMLGYLKVPKHRLTCLEYRASGNRLRKMMANMHGDKLGALRGVSGRLTNAQGKPLDAFTDSNLCGSFEDKHKSTSGFSIFHFYHLISWKSKLQPITATSTHEAELIALALGADEVMWIRKTIDELWFCYLDMLLPSDAHPYTPIETSENSGICDAIAKLDEAVAYDPETSDVVPRAMTQFTDTRSVWHDNWRFITRFLPTTINVANLALQFSVTNPDTNKPGSRHLGMRLFKIRDYIAGSCARCTHIGTEFNIADLFTKSLAKNLFWKFTDLIMCQRE
jgi:hypothetical protein